MFLIFPVNFEPLRVIKKSFPGLLAISTLVINKQIRSSLNRINEFFIDNDSLCDLINIG